MILVARAFDTGQNLSPDRYRGHRSGRCRWEVPIQGQHRPGPCGTRGLEVPRGRDPLREWLLVRCENHWSLSSDFPFYKAERSRVSPGRRARQPLVDVTGPRLPGASGLMGGNRADRE